MIKSTFYQLSRAHELNFKSGVAYDEISDTYQVKSISQKNQFYIISKDRKNLVCPCVGFHFNGKCSHCVAVRVFQRSAKK